MKLTLSLITLIGWLYFSFGIREAFCFAKNSYNFNIRDNGVSLKNNKDHLHKLHGSSYSKIFSTVSYLRNGGLLSIMGSMFMPSKSREKTYGNTFPMRNIENRFDDTISPFNSSLSIDSVQTSSASKHKESLAIKGWLERLTYSWVQPLMEKGNKEVLEMESLWKMPTQQDMSNASDTFQDLLYHEQNKSKGKVNKKSIGLKILQDFWSSPVTKAIMKM